MEELDHDLEEGDTSLPKLDDEAKNIFVLAVSNDDKYGNIHHHTVISNAKSSKDIIDAYKEGCRQSGYDIVHHVESRGAFIHESHMKMMPPSFVSLIKSRHIKEQRMYPQDEHMFIDLWIETAKMGLPGLQVNVLDIHDDTIFINARVYTAYICEDCEEEYLE